MKKTMGFTALLLAFLLLFGCTSVTGKTAGPEEKVVKISEFLADDGAYLEAAKRMDAGDIPRMEFFCQLVMDEISDPDKVKDFWYRLGEIGIYPDESEELDILDGDIFFSFMWEDGTKVTIGFITSEYFNADDGLIPTEKPSQVRAITEDLMLAWEMQEEAKAEDPQIQESAAIEVRTTGPFIDFEWDLDGDGEKESFDGRFYDNGDEAPSAIKITCFFRGEEQNVWIDRAYGIIGAVEKEDAEQGRYLELEYYIGDYYGHDNTAFCNLYLNETGELEVAGEYL